MEKSDHPPPYVAEQPPPPTHVTVGRVPQQQMIIGSPTIIVEHPVGPKPTPYTCRSCNTQIVTRVESKNIMKTHMFALLLCVFGCWPCVCIPYCIDSCKSIDHYCPHCDAYIGSYKD